MKSLFNEAYNEIMAGTRLDEIKMSRVWNYVQDDNYSFGVVSAFRGTNDLEKNEQLSDQLENDIKKLGKGYVRMNGGFVETDNGRTKEVREKSFLIIDKTDNAGFKQQIIELGRNYEQDSVLYKDSEGFYEIATSTRNNHKVGQEINSYMVKAGKDNLTFAKNLIKHYFSELIYGPNHGKKFLFQQVNDSIDENKFILQEYKPIEHNPRWLAVARGETSKWITITED